MTLPSTERLHKFMFRDLHPDMLFGTASDRYAGWIGQIYSEERYEGRISRRTKKVGEKTFVEEVLPVASVKEYFQHFHILELDFTFYRPLLDRDGKPTQNFHLLRNYRRYLNKDDILILKVPQSICAGKLWRGKNYTENDQYLNPDIFTRQFCEPARELLDPWLGGLIFEQEYQRMGDRPAPEKFAVDLDTFFSSVPQDTRYHVELRTKSLLCSPVFSVFEKHGLGQVLSNWTWLPTLTHQFALSGHRIFNAERTSVMRMMTPLGMRYAEAYALAHPFTALVEGMLDEQQIKNAAELAGAIINQGCQINVLVNNRYGGNAPLSVQHIAQQFLGMISD